MPDMELNVTQTDIARGLRQVGLAAGDVVMVHSSLSRFGRVAGGAGAVVRALLEVLGPAGTLVAPTFSTFFVGPPGQVFDRERTPSRMGAISEAVRTWPGARRSSHPGHPVSAIGARAAEIAGLQCDVGWGPDSPLAALERLDARLLLLGVGYNTVTIFHVPEYEARVPYRRVQHFTGTVIIDGRPGPVRMPMFRRLPDLKYDFEQLGRELEGAGLVRETTIGRSHVRLFDVPPALALERDRIAADPLYLLDAESRQRFERSQDGPENGG